MTSNDKAPEPIIIPPEDPADVRKRDLQEHRKRERRVVSIETIPGGWERLGDTQLQAIPDFTERDVEAVERALDERDRAISARLEAMRETYESWPITWQQTYHATISPDGYRLGDRAAADALDVPYSTLRRRKAKVLRSLAAALEDFY